MNQHLAAAGEVGGVAFDTDVVGLLLLAHRRLGGNTQAMPAKIGQRIANAKLVYRSPLGLVGDPERMLARDVEVFLRPVLADGELVERIDLLDGADMNLRDAPQGDGARLGVLRLNEIANLQAFDGRMAGFRLNRRPGYEAALRPKGRNIREAGRGNRGRGERRRSDSGDTAVCTQRERTS